MTAASKQAQSVSVASERAASQARRAAKQGKGKGKAPASEQAPAPQAPQASAPVAVALTTKQAAGTTKHGMVMAQVRAQDGTLAARTVWSARKDADGAMRGHVVIRSRELEVVQGADGVWVCKGPKVKGRKPWVDAPAVQAAAPAAPAK